MFPASGKDERPMTADDKNRIRDLLRDERAKLVADVRAHLGDRLAAEDVPGDPGDRSDLELNRALEHRIALDEAHLIQKIDLALQRLEEGTYGLCEDCGVPIPLERLLAKPSVSRCRSCQQAKEDHSNVESIH
jgi:DnaK suppressor protein